MTIGDRRVSADEAAAIGLVSRVVNDADLAGEVEIEATQLAGAATGAIGRTRALLLASYGAALEARPDAEFRSIAASVRTTDGQEGIAAFLAKRRPQFGPKGKSQ